MSKAEELFIEETGEVLNQLEENLLAIQADHFNEELMQSILRLLHTIKGSLLMFDRKELGDFTHELESVFDAFNGANYPLSEDVTQLMLNAVDFIRETFHQPKLQTDDQKDLLEMFSSTISSAAQSTLKFVENESQSSELVTSLYFLMIKPRISIKDQDGHPLHFIIRDLLDEHESLGHIESQGTSILEWRVLFVSNLNEAEIRAIFLFVEEDLDLSITQFPIKGVSIKEVKLESFRKKLVIKKAKALIPELEQFVKAFKESDFRKPDDLRRQKEKMKVQEVSRTTNFIKVEQGKVDDLMNWISELVTIQAALKNQAEKTDSEALLNVSESLHFITENIRDTIFSISLVPLKTLETQFTRLVRDLSRDLGKEITFQSTGFETELDRKVIANLKEPLLHILRNSIDHGIEKPDIRKQAGKTASGNIMLKSYYSGNLVFIEITDDGAGIDPLTLRKKAEEKGLLNTDDHYTDDDILQLVFHPGLSTADNISDISGRGVGMDIVRRKIMELRGEVSISSEPGKGTKTIVKLPLSLTILEGLHTRVGNTHLIMPMNTIREIHRFDRKTFYDRPKGSDILEFDGKQLSVVSIEEKYQIASSGKDTVDVITVNIGNIQKGVAVDEIKGQVQTVLKPLGEYYEKQDFILGGTILGDGNLAFVLDMEKLIN
ncbi:MAG: chemotaxis protein CheA [Cytophagales bacterium]|nr:chemotaxis protein CheA [Cytophagales bacterium]